MAVLPRLSKAVFPALAGALAACGGGGGGDGSSRSAGIVGLWDASYTVGEREDVIYFEIDTDLSITLYDYYGDSFDQGANCFVVYEGSRLSPLGDDRYTSTGDDGVDLGEVTLRREGDVLVSSFVDEFDEDDDGDTSEIVVERNASVVGLSSTDFDRCREDAVATDPGLFADGPAAKDGLPRVIAGR